MLAVEREIFHRLLTHFHPDDFENFFKYFEEPERVALSKMNVIVAPLHLRLDNPQEIFHRIHYSWFIEALKKLPQNILESCLSLFSPRQQRGLYKLKLFKKPNKSTQCCLKGFYIQYLLKTIGYDTLCPRCILPPSENQFFLNFSKDQLIVLIQHLGILELANISKKVVDKKIIKQIEKMLTQSQKKLYNLAKMSSEPKAASVRDISKVIADKKTFAVFIEKRGIERFARGIVLEHPYFIWHIAHLLDKGRGEELLIKSRRFMPNPYTPFFTKQILEVAQTLEAKEST